ncbi:MAG: hypothetical protein IMZ46_08080 [Acidobacteria bacterium]|nr:hypothetical protein [Acidobacteriota bacterium]
MLIVVLAVPTGVFFFFYHMYHNDIKALRGFIASYERFDKAISDLSMSKADDLEGQIGSAVSDIEAKASLRLSSLIKNDAELMDQAIEVADLARRELEGLRVYRSEIQNKNADLDGLAEESRILTGRRKAAYARFQELSGTR